MTLYSIFILRSMIPIPRIWHSIVTMSISNLCSPLRFGTRSSVKWISCRKLYNLSMLRDLFTKYIQSRWFWSNSRHSHFSVNYVRSRVNCWISRGVAISHVTTMHHFSVQFLRFPGFSWRANRYSPGIVYCLKWRWTRFIIDPLLWTHADSIYFIYINYLHYIY